MTTTKRPPAPTEKDEPGAREQSEDETTTLEPEAVEPASNDDGSVKEGAPAGNAPIGLPEPPRRRSVWRTVKRLFVTLVVVALVAAAAVAAWPLVNERVIQPISDNTAQLDALATDLAGADARIAELETQLGSILAAEGGLPARLDDMEGRLTGVEGLTSDLGQQVDSLAVGLDALTTRVDALEGSVVDVSGTVDALSVQLTAEAKTLRAMEMMSRARLFLYQANYGLAVQDLTAARAVLATADGSTTLAPAIERLDSAIAALPDRPVLAADELDIAWALLLEGGQAAGSADAPATDQEAGASPSEETP